MTALPPLSNQPLALQRSIQWHGLFCHSRRFVLSLLCLLQSVVAKPCAFFLSPCIFVLSFPSSCSSDLVSFRPLENLLFTSEPSSCEKWFSFFVVFLQLFVFKTVVVTQGGNLCNGQALWLISSISWLVRSLCHVHPGLQLFSGHLMAF